LSCSHARFSNNAANMRFKWKLCVDQNSRSWASLTRLSWFPYKEYIAFGADLVTPVRKWKHLSIENFSCHFSFHAIYYLFADAPFTLCVQTLSYQLTCAVNAITGESLIAFTPVTLRPSRGAHVRCNWSTCGVLMTNSRCVGSTAPRIWFHIYTTC